MNLKFSPLLKRPLSTILLATTSITSLRPSDDSILRLRTILRYSIIKCSVFVVYDVFLTLLRYVSASESEFSPHFDIP
jgi:hypothetical protein